MRNGDRCSRANRSTSSAKRTGMCSWPSCLRTTWAFLPSTRALSLERLGRLRELADARLVQQRGDAAVDVLGAVVGVEAEDDEREHGQQRFEKRNHEPLRDARQRTRAISRCRGSG